MKNIVLCSDGTGNSGGKERGTNVWRLFEAVDPRAASVRQVRFYDDGVGTGGTRWVRVAGGAFGWGLSRNIRQLYEHLVEAYDPGSTTDEPDRIFLFGFSRGAFTVRALAGMIGACGALDRDAYHSLSVGRRERLLKRLLRHYRTAKRPPREQLEQQLRKAFFGGEDRRLLHDAPIRFIGVWDTVDAVGVPVDELRVGADKAWRALTGRRLYGFHDQVLGEDVERAAQALALDDERKTFWPNVWKADPRIEQVWFAGAHSNVGGGYPKDAMAYVTLDWMMGHAEVAGLVFAPGEREKVRARADVNGHLYDSRSGMGAFYRLNPRLDSRAKRIPRDEEGYWGQPLRIHASVYERIRNGIDGYAPVLPDSSDSVPDGDPEGPYVKTVAEPVGLGREAVEAAWRSHRRRIRTHRAFVGAVGAGALLLGFLAWRTPVNPDLEALAGVASALGPVPFSERIVSGVVAHPIPVLVAALVIWGLWILGRRLRRQTNEEARAAWRASLRQT